MGRSGYGQFSSPHQYKTSMVAHRVMYGVAFGYVPHGLNVMHTCDNPPCCNPFHLKLGTHIDNMRDMVVKGRAARRTKDVCIRGHQKGHGNQCDVCRRISADAIVARDRARADEMREEFKRERLLSVVAPDLTGLIQQVANERGAVAIADFFGLYGREHRTLSAIGADWGLTRERVRQLRNDALDRLGLDHGAVISDFKYRLRFRDAIVARRQDTEAA